MEDPKNDELDFMTKTRLIRDAALELKADQIVALDMRQVSSCADSFVIASGGSNRHVRAIADAIIKAVEESDERPLGVEGLEEARWVLIDANDVIVHVFASDFRDDFSLERLWSDAPPIPFEAETKPEA